MITSINEFKKTLINENFNDKVKITPDVYDEQDINIFTLVDAENMNFGDWDTAIKWLIKTLRYDEELYNYLRSELSTKDDVVLGDIKIAGSDVIDHLRLVDDEKYYIEDEDDFYEDEDEFNESVENDDVNLSKELKDQLYIGDFE